MKKKRSEAVTVITETGIMIRQPNRLTEAHHVLTITQLRILITVIDALQADMELYNNGCQISQLNLYDNPSDSLLIRLPMNCFSKTPRTTHTLDKKLKHLRK